MLRDYLQTAQDVLEVCRLFFKIYFYYIIRITKNILIQSINHEITLILNTDFFELFVISR